MKRCLAIVVLISAPLCISAQTAIKSCDDLKTEIAKKIDSHGGANYTLNIVDKGKEADGKIVGSCGGGTKSIVYEKAAPAAQNKPAPKVTPASETKPK